jgi:hypothetical protein
LRLRSSVAMQSALATFCSHTILAAACRLFPRFNFLIGIKLSSAFLRSIERSDNFPVAERCTDKNAPLFDVRRHHQIPAHKRERRSVARFSFRVLEPGIVGRDTNRVRTKLSVYFDSLFDVAPCKHAGDTTAAQTKTPGFSLLSEF